MTKESIKYSLIYSGSRDRIFLIDEHGQPRANFPIHELDNFVNTVKAILQTDIKLLQA